MRLASQGVQVSISKSAVCHSGDHSEVASVLTCACSMCNWLQGLQLYWTVFVLIMVNIIVFRDMTTCYLVAYQSMKLHGVTSQEAIMFCIKADKKKLHDP
jgi:hypothetical protein